MNAPLVSVLLPFRECAATIAEALEGVLAEREIDLEVVAVDDGSRDAGASIVAAIASRDGRVRAVRGEGGGIVSALEIARSHARGAFIARMDADDRSLPGRFGLQIAALERDRSLGVVGTQIEAFPAHAVGEGLARYVAWQNALLTPADHAREIFVESPLCHPSVMLRRDALDAVGGWRESRWAEDYDLWLRLDRAGYAMAKVPRVLLAWRQREGRLTFSDPRYALDRFIDARAEYLPPRLAAMTAGREVWIWGAGPTGKRLGRALERRGVRARGFIDIDPHKRVARGVPVVLPDAIRREKHAVIVAVGARGARTLIRATLDAAGFVEGADYVCAA